MNVKKAVLLSAVVMAFALALSACAGFKAEQIKAETSSVTVTGGPGTTNTPYVAPAYAIQIDNSMPIVNFMATLNPEVQTILNDPNFMGPPYLAGRMEILFRNLTPDNSVSAGTGSQIRFQGILQGATAVEVRMDSADARLYLDTTVTPARITGYWNFETSAGRATLAIDGTPVRANMVSTLAAYNLQGTLSGAFGNQGNSEELGTFSIPLCSMMQDTSWVQDSAAACH